MALTLQIKCDICLKQKHITKQRVLARGWLSNDIYMTALYSNKKNLREGEIWRSINLLDYVLSVFYV